MPLFRYFSLAITSFLFKLASKYINVNGLLYFGRKIQAPAMSVKSLLQINGISCIKTIVFLTP